MEQAKYLAKGRSVYIEGKLQTRQWDDKNGNRRYTTEIVAQTVQFLGGGSKNADMGASAGASAQPNYTSAPNLGSQDMPGIDPSLDDIPF